MNKEDILRMALEAGIIPWEKMEWSNNRFVSADEGMDGDLACLMQFAAFVAAHEREACAKLCEMIADNAVMPTANECAKTIRRRQSK